MTPKVKGDDEKRSRKRLSLCKKIEILDKLKEGGKLSAVAKHYKVNESSIRSIRRTEEKIRASVSASDPVSAEVTSVSTRNATVIKMERLLYMWIGQVTDTTDSEPNGMEIRRKALDLYELVTSNEVGITDHKPFKASKGWLDRFKRRFNLSGDAPQVKNMSVNDHIDTGPDDMEMVPSNDDEVNQFLPEFQNFIREAGYLPDQVFNADETFLFYKRFPERTYVTQEIKKASGFKSYKDGSTLLFCANASGDFKCKPMLVYRADTPRALKGKNKLHLPVHWRSTRRGLMRSHIFDDWFNNCFVHEVKEYLARKNLVFKVLLLVDGDSCHSIGSLNLIHPNVEVMCFPPNTAPKLQPMSRGVIRTFKSYYTRRMYRRAVQKLNSSATVTLMEYWRSYNIRDGLEIIKDAWEEIQPTTINTSWYNLWPESVTCLTPIVNVTNDIISLSKELGGEGFSDVTELDIEELIEFNRDELTNEDLQQVVEISCVSEEEKEDDEQRPQLTVESLMDVFRQVDEATEYLVELDPILDRSLKVKRDIQNVLTPYRELLLSMKMKSQTGLIASQQ